MFIHKEDVLSLLNNIERIGEGLLHKGQFIDKLHSLKQHEKVTSRRKINYIKDLKLCIENYKKEIKYNRKTGYLEAYSNSLDWSEKDMFQHFMYKIVQDGFSKHNIIPACNLKDILKIQQRTVSDWTKKKIIPKHYTHKSYNIVKSDYYIFKFYDLSEIENSLNSLL
jgi:hypothetical protein